MVLLYLNLFVVVDFVVKPLKIIIVTTAAATNSVKPTATTTISTNPNENDIKTICKLLDYYYGNQINFIVEEISFEIISNIATTKTS
ncbi:7683_t:CDS:2 [Entrophospora sp. SA101]|nr:7683_t:CDS:2 [Entrophospora sp. SA101]CAJ0834416.1 5206_t:CDS:2 [Entrophospora sp. SA101]CAJ0849845.1 13711_t:CDS:2 [Entrophospora sp. SA101]